MGYTENVLNEIRDRIDAHPEPLAEARIRLGLVRSAAIRFPGAKRTYASGSLPQHTFVHPVRDGDGGLVLDRRVYPQLGPEGGEQTRRKSSRSCVGCWARPFGRSTRRPGAGPPSAVRRCGSAHRSTTRTQPWT